MRPYQLGFLLIVTLLGGCFSVQAQKGWFTPAVAAALGHETCAKCPAPDYKPKVYQVRKSMVYSMTIAYFDTIASFVQGRVVDKKTHQSIKGAQVLIRYCSAFRTDVETKTATTDGNGIFIAGWIGYSGTQGPRSNRLLSIQYPGYESINTTAVSFGALGYLHIELAALRKPR